MSFDTIAILAMHGDPLEQAICKHVVELRCVLQPYSEIWYDHIYFRRIEDGTKVVPEWMNFAGSHYSALLRLHHAYLSYCELQRMSIEEVPYVRQGDFLLRVHRHWASFWENIGTCIDNLAKCHECSVPYVIKEKAQEELMRNCEKINYAYNRRTQFIHSRIVPLRIEDDIVRFRVRTADMRVKELEPKEMIWSIPFDTELVLGDVISEEWSNFLGAISDVWYALRSEVRKRDTEAPKCMALHFPDMSATEVFNLVMNLPLSYIVPSNVTPPTKQKPVTKRVDPTPFFGTPTQPSG